MAYLAARFVGLAFVITLLYATTVGQLPRPSRTAAPRPYPDRSIDANDLRSAQQALGQAREAEDASAIISGSRHLIALTLRQIGDLRLKQGNSNAATELFLRSIHFEDAAAARKRLQAAYSMQSTGLGPTSRSDTDLNDSSRGNSHGASTAPTSRDKTEQSLIKMLARALNDLGTIEARQQNYSLALGHFHEAERWDPETQGLMRNIGLTAMQLSDYAEAVRALKPALAANPDDRVARSILGTALYSRNAFADASEVLAPLGDTVLQQPELAYTRAASLVKTNHFAEATALLDKLEKQPLSTEMTILVAQTWSQMGNYARTVQACQRVVQADPAALGAHHLAGLALIRLDRASDAAQEFRAELGLDPGSTDSKFHLAFVLLQQSQNEEAVEWLRKVLAVKPEHAEANYELGKELQRNGKSADAIPYLEMAVRLRPDLEAAHYQLQAAYRAVGRKEEADREAKVYREMKANSRNIKLPPPPAQTAGAHSSSPERASGPGETK